MSLPLPLACKKQFKKINKICDYILQCGQDMDTIHMLIEIKKIKGLVNDLYFKEIL